MNLATPHKSLPHESQGTEAREDVTEAREDFR